MNTTYRSVLLALAFAGWLPSAGAHYVWLESDGAQARLYFGEYENRLREKSPGALDRVKGAQAWQLAADGSKSPVDVRAQAESFAIVSSGLPVVIEQAADRVVDMSQHGGQGKVRSVRYARLDTPAADARPALALEIVPAKGDALAYRVLLNGAPLAKAKVELHAPNGWSRELTSDAQGVVRISAPWAGAYVLQTSQTLPQPGELKGEKYDGVRMSATLTVRFEQPLGAQ